MLHLYSAEGTDRPNTLVFVEDGVTTPPSFPPAFAPRGSRLEQPWRCISECGPRSDGFLSSAKHCLSSAGYGLCSRADAHGRYVIINDRLVNYSCQLTLISPSSSLALIPHFFTIPSHHAALSSSTLSSLSFCR